MNENNKKKDDIKLLIITRNVWANYISTGNTLTNLFGDWETKNIANLYCRDERSDHIICRDYYRISESKIIKSVFNRKAVGDRLYYDKIEDIASDTANIVQEVKQGKLYDYFRSHKLTLLLWAREFVWSLGNWKNDKLREFLDDFKPNYLYMSLYDCFYMHKILKYIKKYTDAKVMIYTGDDRYSFKQFSFSPLYWINLLILRHFVKGTINSASLCYCYTQMHADEYNKIFHNKFQVLNKGVEIDTARIEEKVINKPVKMAYTGNITLGRYKTLGYIADAINKINIEEKLITLDIFSTNLLTNKMKKTLNLSENVVFRGGIDAQKVKIVQADADILIHVEDFSLANRLKVRLSLSTKIIDYIARGKCIFAVGNKNVASMDYLIKNDIAIAAITKDEILNKLNIIINNYDIINQYAEKGMQYGLQHHQIEKIRKRLLKEMVDSLNER